jgi:hypothetical protein
MRSRMYRRQGPGPFIFSNISTRARNAEDALSAEVASAEGGLDLVLGSVFISSILPLTAILCESDGGASQGFSILYEEGETMDEQRFNMSMRKILKVVGVTSQHEIERLVQDEKLGGKGELKVKMVLTAKGRGSSTS